ncbi:MAG: autotransporter-associated beta strand repeat-containing protein [Chthoniobacterales bacterium]
MNHHDTLYLEGEGIYNLSNGSPRLATSGGFLVLDNFAAIQDQNIQISNLAGGATYFQDNASAGTASIRNNSNGGTIFNKKATAGSSTIYNTTSSSGTAFYNFSNASQSSIHNTGGGGAGFLDTSHAGNAVITNSGSGSVTLFTDSSHAEDATITNDNGGMTIFDKNSSADNVSITVSDGSSVQFYDNAKGAMASFNIKANAIFDMSGHKGSLTIGSLQGDGDIYLGKNNLILGLDDFSNTITSPMHDGGLLKGVKGGLVKTGLGALITTAMNTYTGTTTIKSGTLQIGDGMTDGGLSSESNIMNNGILIFDQHTDGTIANMISGKGSAAQNGSNVLTLSAANTYTGGTTVGMGGTLITANAKAMGAATGKLEVDGVLDLGGNNITVGQLTVDTTGSVLNNAVTAASLTTNSSAASSIKGYLSDGNGKVTLVKAGKGVLTIDDAGNSYSGGTVLAAGEVDIETTTAFGTGALTMAGTSILDNTSGAPITLTANNAQNWNANLTFKGTNNLDMGTGNVVMNATRTVTVGAGDGTTDTGMLTIGGDISGTKSTYGLTKAGMGILALTGANTYTGNTTISAGVLAIGDGTTDGGILPGSKVLDNGKLLINLLSDATIANVISGKGQLVKGGASSVTLTGVNTYTGANIIVSGKIVAGSSKALGSGVAPLLNYGTLDLNGNNIIVGQLLVRSDNTAGFVINNGNSPATLTTSSSVDSEITGNIADGIGTLALVKSGKGALSINDNGNAYSGGTTLNAGRLNINTDTALGSGTFTIAGVSTIDNTSSGLVTLAANNTQNWNANFTFKGSRDLNLGAGAVTMNATRTITVNAGTLTVGGVISGAKSTYGLTKAGNGAMVLTGINTYTGTTTISAGILQIGDGTTDGSVGNTKIVDNGTLIANLVSDIIVDNVISGKGGLVKNGVNALTLSAANTYTGGATVNAGTLKVGNSAALGKGNVALVGGKLATDGDQHQIMVNGSLSWSSDAQVSLSLDDAERITIVGSLSRPNTGALKFDFTYSSDPDAPFNFLVLTADKGFGSLTTADFDYLSNNPDLLGVFNIVGKDLFFSSGLTPTSDMAVSEITTDNITFESGGSTGGSFPLQTSAVPEPSTWLLLAMSFGGLFLMRRSMAI